MILGGKISILTHDHIGSVQFAWLDNGGGGDGSSQIGSMVEVTFIPKKWMPFWMMNDVRLNANQSVEVLRDHAREMWVHLVDGGWRQEEKN